MWLTVIVAGANDERTDVAHPRVVDLQRDHLHAGSAPRHRVVDFIGIGDRIVHIHATTEFIELVNNIKHAAIAHIIAIFFKGRAHDQYFRALDFL